VLPEARTCGNGADIPLGKVATGKGVLLAAGFCQGALRIEERVPGARALLLCAWRATLPALQRLLVCALCISELSSSVGIESMDEAYQASGRAEGDPRS
jgi:hypothetical protein